MQHLMPPEVARLCTSIARPAYVYDLSQLKETASQLRDAFGTIGAQILFATMANPRPEILATLATLKIGACVNSVLHLRAALEAGIDSRHIQFTSSGLSVADLEAIAGARIQCNVDSKMQAVALLEVMPKSTLGVRLNTRLLLGERPGIYDRLGTDPSELAELRDLIEMHGGQLNGAHIYVGTNFHSHVEMLPALDAFFKSAATIPTLQYVNVGGGIGVDYSGASGPFDIMDYVRAIDLRMQALQDRLGRAVKLIVEPGRAMVASAGYFTCRVTDLKVLREMTFVGVNASVAQFPRPWHHPDTPHRVYCAQTVLRSGAGPSAEIPEAIVTGCTTYSKDVLSVARLPDNIEVGDSLIFVDAGAYCDSMASRFLGRGESDSVFMN